jgi:pyruvate ferredoxin oxidoreductase gamma subunit
MYRIRFHGRGGQGMKTASRVLGSAFFFSDFEVQDAPRYGAERRGAPIFAYVRAARRPIHERGVIRKPDLVVVADDSLVSVPAAGVLLGVDTDTVLLIDSREPAELWRHRLNLDGPILTLPAFDETAGAAHARHVGIDCAAAARLVGEISWDALNRAIDEELGPLGTRSVEENRAAAREVFEKMATHAGLVGQRPEMDARSYERPDWVDVPAEAARISAPTIHAAATSVEVKTGLWRTLRPVIDRERCRRCWWVCSTLCPDSAIDVGNDGEPLIDYDYCKGCMICVAVCPHHAIDSIPERVLVAETRTGAET